MSKYPLKKPLLSPAGLLEKELVTSEVQQDLKKVTDKYAMRITPNVLSAIEEMTYEDPVFKQYVPDMKELNFSNDEGLDPVSDEKYSPLKGIVHRHKDRVLLKIIHICPVYCRFCFRREYVGPQGDMLTEPEVDMALNYIRSHKDIWEVILTGGDPLMLSSRKLLKLFRALHEINHIGVIRIHSRVPVADPDRIDTEKMNAIKGRKAVYLVIHCNHANELTSQSLEACGLFTDAGIPVLCESVLLKGVNDNEEALENLMRKLVENRIKPYYLHHLDKAKGTGHFRVVLEKGQKLVKKLLKNASGLCQPTYVLDIPGGYGKVPVHATHIKRKKNREWSLKDADDNHHNYTESE